LACGARPAPGAKSTSAGAAAARHSARAATAGTEAGAGSTASSTAASGALRSENHLKELVGVLKEILEFVALSAESFRGELCGYFDSCNGRIFRNVPNFVDLDAGLTGERGF
jgi:hypothetical protein